MSHPTGEQLEAYVIDPGAHADIEHHVSRCPSCQAVVSAEAKLELELHALAAGCLECARPVDGDVCGHCGAIRRLPGYTLEAIKVHHARGRLYVARDREGHRVAIKELVFAHAPGLEAVLAFEREAKFLHALRHPAIPRFAASFTRGEGVHTRMYLVQDYVDGESLADQLTHHHFTEAELKQIAHRVLSVLCYLQAMTPMVFHRDIKPANLIAGPDGSIALVDFGAARDLGATTGATLVGTFGYMPIEQLVGTVDATSDLYSLGMSLLHLATRIEPWELDAKIKARAHLSRPFRAFLDKLTAKDPSRRYRGAAAALQELEAPRRQLARMYLVPLSIAAVVGASTSFVGYKLLARNDGPARVTPTVVAPVAPVAPPVPTVPVVPPRLPRAGAIEPAEPGPTLTSAELAALDHDIAQLREADPAPERVREIESGLDAATVESDPADIILAGRSPAAVALLLRSAVVMNRRTRAPEFATLFTSLTGHAVSGGRLEAATAIDLVRTWWQDVRANVITDPCKLAREPRRAIERALAQHHWRNERGPNLGWRNEVLDVTPGSDVPIGPGCSVMVGELLSMVDDEPAIHNGIASMLTTLRRRGLATELGAVVHDAKRSVVQRFIALLAIANASEPLMEDELLALYAASNDPTLHEPMLKLMKHGDARVVPVLIHALDGSDAERRAALDVIELLKPPSAIPALRRVLLTIPMTNGSQYTMYRMLAAIGTVEAVDAMADGLERLATGGSDDTYDLTMGFSEAQRVGQKFMSPPTNTPRERRIQPPAPVAEPRTRDERPTVKSWVASWRAWRASNH